MTIKFDRSAETGILITCTLCDYWFAYRFDQAEAYDSGAGHAMRAHDDTEESQRVGTLKSRWSSRKVRPQVEDAPHGTPRPSAHRALEHAHADSVADRLDR